MPTSSAPNDSGVDQLAGNVVRWEFWLRKKPYWIIAVVAWLLVALKAGVVLVEPSVSSLESFPYPEDRLTGTSYGLRVMAWAVQTESSDAYALIALMLVVVAMIVIPWTLSRRLSSVDASVAVLLLACGSIGTVLLGNVGRSDVLVILGAALIGILGQSWRWAAFGALLMLLGNPEQGVVGIIAYLLCCADPRLRERRRPALVALVIAVSGLGAVTLAARANGGSSRFAYLQEYLGNALYHFGHNWPLSIYAAYGVLWIIICFALLTGYGWSRWLVFAGAVALPMLATALTLDQTRVFVGVSAAAAFALVTETVPTLVGALTRLRAPVLVLTLALAVMMPSLEIDFHGTVRATYEWIFTSVLQ